MTIQEFFALYKNNIRLSFELDDSLFETGDKFEWFIKLKSRSKKLRDTLQNNQWIISSLNDVVSESLTREDAETLLNECVSSIIEGMSDAELQYPLLLQLSNYFKANNDLAAYITCLYYAGFVQGEIIYRSGAIENIVTSIDEMIIEEKDHYDEIEDENVRSIFLMSYHNLAICSVTSKEYYPTSYKYLMEMEEFWASEKVQKLDGDNPMFIEYMNTTRRLWLQLNFDRSDRDTEACRYYLDSCQKHFDAMYAECGDDVKKYLIQTYGPYLNSRVIKGEITYEEAVNLFYVKYRDYMDQALGGRDQMEFICYGLLPTLSMLTDLLNHVEDRDFKRKYFDILVTDLSKYGTKHNHETQVDSAVNQALAELCINALPTIEGKESKEHMLFNLVIKRQLPTYLHSMMTMKIATLIADHAWDHLPHYFDELGYDNKKDFVNFVSNCALFHDLGKIKITDIVNMQRRKLGEVEFTSIKRHPGIGADIVKNDPDLSAYHDVILGHHKFFDGTFGYPVSFDNTKSKQRKVIDIITIADCLDAATDNYSRNYKMSKTLSELIAELVEAKGTRYNPDLVGLIDSSDILQAKLEIIAEDERLDMMYEAYSAGKEKYI